MNNFIETDPKELDFNAFSKIGDEWMLLSSGESENFNLMTASWGGVGVLWGKNVAFIFVRPARYTYLFIEKNDTFSICFFDKKYKNALNFCGSKSGRDFDKAKECNLSPVFIDNTVAYEEASIIITCKKMYASDINKENMLDSSIMDCYKNNDFHRMYIGEILKVYRKNKAE
ncbi:MAG: flavin reductase family protein [Clostridia bacterium]